MSDLVIAAGRGPTQRDPVVLGPGRGLEVGDAIRGIDVALGHGVQLELTPLHHPLERPGSDERRVHRPAAAAAKRKLCDNEG